jgi:hypothetical protein
MLKRFWTLTVLMMRWPALGEQWPAVREATRRFEVNLADGLVAIELPIMSKTGGSASAEPQQIGQTIHA